MVQNQEERRVYYDKNDKRGKKKKDTTALPHHGYDVRGRIWVKRGNDEHNPSTPSSSSPLPPGTAVAYGGFIHMGCGITVPAFVCSCRFLILFYLFIFNFFFKIITLVITRINPSSAVYLD